MASPICTCDLNDVSRLAPPCCACSTRHRGTAAFPAALRCWRCSAGTCLRAVRAPGPSFFSLSRWWDRVELRNVEFLLNLADHQSVGMRRQQQLHNAQPRLGSHGRKHVGILGDLLRFLLDRLAIFRYLQKYGYLSSEVQLLCEGFSCSGTKSHCGKTFQKDQEFMDKNSLSQ